MKKKLRIAQVAPLWYPAPPSGYGGTEMIVSRLTEGLVARGHQVTLYASGDSRTGGRKVSIVDKSLTKLGVPWTAPGYNLLNLEKAFADAGRFDVIHTHIDPFDGFFRAASRTPSLATLHNHFWPFHRASAPRFNDRIAVYERFKRLPYVAISDYYRRACPVKLNFAATIHHGVAVEKFAFNAKPDDHFLWLGRIAAVKGLHNAVLAAKRAGAKLTIGGAFITKESKEYYDREVRRHVDGRRIRYVGEITKQNKSRFLKSGKALLYPIEWDEPFGLVMVEALACGTPVIAYDRGSVSEIVKDGETGFVVDDLGSLVRAMKNIGEIDRGACRRSAENEFSLELMLDRYEAVYRSML